MRRLIIILTLSFFYSACVDRKQQAESILRHYIDKKVDQIRNYRMESELALWNATVTGNESDYQKIIDIELNFNKTHQNTANLFVPDRLSTLSQNVFTNQQDFDLLRKLRDSGLITDTLLKRQLNVLFQTFMGSQIETERYRRYMMREIDLWQVFSSIKVEVGGKKYGSTQLDSIRKNSNDTLAINTITEAYQTIGKKIAPDIIKMVKDRNELAVAFGYPDYYYLALDDKDQTPEKIKQILDELELKTRTRFFEAKMVIDKMLCKRFDLNVNKLQPWYYNDERTTYLPKRFTQKLDSLFVNHDPVQLASDFFSSIRIPIQDVIDNSRLEPGPGKANLTAMVNIDFKNDIRLVAGITSSYDGMSRMMHLVGHASHFKSISDKVPYLLKTPNLVISEGIARYFENLASDYEWLSKEMPIDGGLEKQVVLICQHLHQVDMLFRCRKLMALAEFEREIYHNPDQDLDLLWHNVNLKYMGFDYLAVKGSGYWAANKFAASLSCTVHNFVLADIFASQLKHTIQSRFLSDPEGAIKNNTTIGNFLLNDVYGPGNLFLWEDLIEKANGEPLNSAYFVDELVGSDDKNERNQ